MVKAKWITVAVLNKTAGAEMSSTIAGLLTYMGEGDEHPLSLKKLQTAITENLLTHSSHSGATEDLLPWESQDLAISF